MLGLILFICIDYKDALKAFYALIDFIREYPVAAAFAIIGIIILLNLFLMPIT